MVRLSAPRRNPLSHSPSSLKSMAHAVEDVPRRRPAARRSVTMRFVVVASLFLLLLEYYSIGYA